MSGLPGAEHEQQADDVADAVMRMPPSTPSALPAACAAHGASASNVQAALSSGGQPLDTATRAHYEVALDQDLGAVRVHTGAAARQSALGMGANAYTIGSDIVFGASRYAPATHEGGRLLAHELTHVVQQRGAGHAAVQLQSGAGKAPKEAALDLMMEMNSTPQEQRAAVVAKVRSKAAEFVAALQVAKSAKPPADGPTAGDLREALRTLADVLIKVDQAQAAVQIAIDSKDAEVQTAIVAILLGRSSGVAGQQRLLSLLAPLAGEKIAAAGPGASSTQWLEANTPAIGRTFSKLETMGIGHFSGAPIAQALSSELLEEYFAAADHDVAPDFTGKVSGLKADSSTRQIEADCDVFATYGARLLREQGWSTVGYMVMLPDEMDPHHPGVPRSAHAVAMAKKPNTQGEGFWYLGISNETIRDLSLWTHDENVLIMLQRLVEEIYDPPSNRYDVYYLPALTGGAYDRKLLDPKNNKLTPYSTRR